MFLKMVDRIRPQVSLILTWKRRPNSVRLDIDLFDIVNSRTERDRGHARLQDRGLDLLSR